MGEITRLELDSHSIQDRQNRLKIGVSRDRNQIQDICRPQTARYRNKEIPVIITNRNRQVGPESALATTTSDDMLIAERLSRFRTERAWHDAQTKISALKTQLAHAELAHAEALAQERKQLDAIKIRLQNETCYTTGFVKQGERNVRQGKPKSTLRKQVVSDKVKRQPCKSESLDGTRAAVLRLVLHKAISHDEACARLKLKPRSLRDLLLIARQNGVEAASKPGRSSTETRVVTRVELHAKRASVLSLLQTGKISRWEACERLKIKPRGLRKVISTAIHTRIPSPSELASTIRR